MFESVLTTPIFGITLTLGSYILALAIARKIGSPAANPIIIAAIACIVFLKVFGIPISHYQIGGQLLMMLILPATISLAVMVYENVTHLKRHLLPIIIGCTVGAGVSISSVIILGRLFELDLVLLRSLVSKSVTTAIAIDLSKVVSGDISLAILAVMVTGISGVLVGPLLLKFLHIEDPTLQGIAMGTSSHVIGTARAMEMGPVQGAISSIALFTTGLATVVMVLLFF